MYLIVHQRVTFLIDYGVHDYGDVSGAPQNKMKNKYYSTVTSKPVNKLGPNTGYSRSKKHVPFSKYHNFPEIAPKDKN